MGGTIHPGILMEKHVLQYYWHKDWLGKKSKAIYFGPKLDWMKEFKERKKDHEPRPRPRTIIKTPETKSETTRDGTDSGDVKIRNNRKTVST